MRIILSRGYLKTGSFQNRKEKKKKKRRGGIEASYPGEGK
jgi:hypothetical protein